MPQLSATISANLPQSMSARRALGIAAMFIVCYVFVALATRIYLVRPFAITPWNPTGGLALAFLLVFGVRFWAALFIASSLVSLLLRGVPAPPFLQLLGPCIVTAGYAGMAWVLRGPLRFNLEFNRLRDVTALVAVAAIGTLLVAITFVNVVRIENFMLENVFHHTVMRSWVGHLIGIAVYTPLLMLLVTGWPRVKRALQQWPAAEMTGQVCVAILALWVIFGSGWAEPNTLFYLLFLPLIWVVMRHGIVGAVLCTACVQFGLIVAIVIADYETGMSVTEIQFLMLAFAVTGLFMGMAVTESHAAADARNHSESQLRVVISTAPDGIMTVDQRGSIVAVNPAATRIFGFTERGLVGMPVLDVLPEFERVARLDEVGEATGIRRDGTRFPAELAVGVTGGGPQGLRIAITRDVTRRKEDERRLGEQQSEINRASRFAAAGEMAAALAHELHQPLAAIRNYARASRMLAGSAGGDEIMNKVEREAGRAAEIVQRLRDFFRSGSSRLERFRVQELVDGAIDPMRAQAAQQRVALEAKIACGTIELLIDRVQIESVIHNLIRNAVEAIATTNDNIRRVRVAAQEAEDGLVQLSVIDTGPGISQAMIARLFEPFATTKSTGTGLGLSMSRSIVEAHSGRLWAEPAAGGGAAFHFTLPRADHKDAIGDEQ